MKPVSTIGRVFLIGAGPGDPELMTLKGLRCLQHADCIIYDSLVNTELLQHGSATAECIYVGKRAGTRSVSQEEINSLLVKRALDGKIVARLKGGDPFIFGRGGEEAEALAQVGIPFEIVPGITSGYAAPAYAGIPVTHRDFSSTVTFVTGHEDPAKEGSRIPWNEIATGTGTLVFFMGVGNLEEIVGTLIQKGKDPNTAIALIQWGTCSDQEVVTGTLATIVSQVSATGLSTPAITIVGEVVRLRDTLKWFEHRPLAGKRIMITRPRHQAQELQKQLTELGAEVVPFPTIEIRDPITWEPLDLAVEHIDEYQWLIFTSVNGVVRFFRRFRERGRDLRELKGIRIAAIGSATEKQITEMGLQVEVLPDEFKAEGLVESLKGKVLKGSRILLPRAKIARDVLPVELAKQGAQVDVVTAYESVLPADGKDRFFRILEERPLHLLVFTSSSTVSNLAELVKPETLPVLLPHTAVASIGPITTKTAESLGLHVDIQPRQYNVGSLLNAITDFFRPQQ